MLLSSDQTTLGKITWKLEWWWLSQSSSFCLVGLGEPRLLPSSTACKSWFEQHSSCRRSSNLFVCCFSELSSKLWRYFSSVPKGCPHQKSVFPWSCGSFLTLTAPICERLCFSEPFNCTLNNFSRWILIFCNFNN